MKNTDLTNFNEWLVNAQKKNLYRDHVRFFILKYWLLLFLYKLTKSIILANIIADIDSAIYRRKLKHWCNSPYQNILSTLVKSIEIEICNVESFPSKIDKVEVLDIRGFDIFNAEAFPCFGENLIAIQSGVFYHSHTLARSLEYILHSDNQSTPSKILASVYKFRYTRVSTGLICRDHTKSFLLWNLIPNDDSLYHGIELFIVAHEYAHCMFCKHTIADFNFGEFFSDDIVSLIMKDEEVAADAFAIIVLDSYVKNNPQDQMAFYGPRFLFKNFSLYESELLLPIPKSHPTYENRYNYIKTMLSSLRDTTNHDTMDSKINKVWDDTKQLIKSASINFKKRDMYFRSIYNNMYTAIKAWEKSKNISHMN